MSMRLGFLLAAIVVVWLVLSANDNARGQHRADGDNNISWTSATSSGSLQ